MRRDGSRSDTDPEGLTPQEVERALFADERLTPTIRRAMLRIFDSVYDVGIALSVIMRGRRRPDD